jgi:hypothetical protein
MRARAPSAPRHTPPGTTGLALGPIPTWANRRRSPFPLRRFRRARPLSYRVTAAAAASASICHRKALAGKRARVTDFACHRRHGGHIRTGTGQLRPKRVVGAQGWAGRTLFRRTREDSRVPPEGALKVLASGLAGGGALCSGGCAATPPGRTRSRAALRTTEQRGLAGGAGGRGGTPCACSAGRALTRSAFARVAHASPRVRQAHYGEYCEYH